MLERTDINYLRQLLKLESAGGLLLIAATVLAIIVANSPLANFYAMILDTHLEIRLGKLGIDKPLLLWINDGLMAIFFFLVGLELKREFLEGELAQPKNIVFPAIGAVGGMLFPALIYIAIVGTDNPETLRGWAIPAATDIAFVLGILALLGNRVPGSVRIFLTSLAIFDDIGAIIIIAIFYTSEISLTALMISACCIPVLFFFNYKGVESKSLYITIGVIMWAALLKSGVHATLAGIVLAFFIPMRSKDDPSFSPVKTLEHDLHFAVAYIILPLFAFTNAGINILGMSFAQATHVVPLGIAAGLLFGKTAGVFGMCWLALKLKVSELPKSMSPGTLLGSAVLCGVGFTMSLFIGSLAFGEGDLSYIFDERLGIIVGSLASGILGYLILNKTLPIIPKKPGKKPNAIG